MKSLIQVNTVYQLFIMINMRLHKEPEGIVDIALSDHTPVLKEYIPGLKESGLFRNVYYMESLKFNNRFWKTKNNNKAALYNHAKKSIAQTLEESKIFYPQYDYLYIANLDAYTKFLHKVFPDLKIIQFEDGAATCSTDWKTISSGWDYIKGFNSIYDAVEGLYLYSPQFFLIISS